MALCAGFRESQHERIAFPCTTVAAAAKTHSAAIGSSRTEARQLSKKWIQTPSVVVRPQSGNLYQELYIAVFPVFSRSCALYRTI